MTLTNVTIAEEVDWEALVEHTPFLLHIPTQTIGKMNRFWDGEKNVHISAHGQPVKGRVIGFENGHTFVAKDENFIVLAEHEAKFYVGCVNVLTEGLKALVRMGAEHEVAPATINVLIVGALRTQATVLEAGHRRAFGLPAGEVVG
jgi:hypothetical protein